MSAAENLDPEPDSQDAPDDFAGTLHVIVVGINSDHTLQQISPGTNFGRAPLAKVMADAHAHDVLTDGLIHMLTGGATDEAHLFLSPIVYSVNSTLTITDRALYHQQVGEVDAVVSAYDDETETPNE